MTTCSFRLKLVELNSAKDTLKRVDSATHCKYCLIVWAALMIVLCRINCYQIAVLIALHDPPVDNIDDKPIKKVEAN